MLVLVVCSGLLLTERKVKDSEDQRGKKNSVPCSVLMDIEPFTMEKLPPLVNDQAETKHCGVCMMDAGGAFLPVTYPLQ